MSFILEGAGREASIAQGIWPSVLALAYAFGWQPQGTIPDKDSGILPGNIGLGSYVFNNDQMVTAQDAYNLGVAIEEALAEYPQVENQDVTYSPSADFEYLKTEDKQLLFQRLLQYDPDGYILKLFVEFCKAGEFTIS